MDRQKHQMCVLVACLLLNSALSLRGICIELIILVNGVAVSAADAGVVKINMVSSRCPDMPAVCCIWQLLCTTSMQCWPTQVQQM